MTLDLDPDRFGNAFIVSDVSRQFAAGNPRYIAGMNGCELARQVLSETHTSFTDAEDVMYIDGILNWPAVICCTSLHPQQPIILKFVMLSKPSCDGSC